MNYVAVNNKSVYKCQSSLCQADEWPERMQIGLSTWQSSVDTTHMYEWI